MRKKWTFLAVMLVFVTQLFGQQASPSRNLRTENTEAMAFTNPVPTYSGGYARDVYYRLDGRALVITSSASSNLLTVDACTGTQVQVPVTDMELPTNGIPCILFFAHGVNRTEISLAVGNMKKIGTGKRYIFARPTDVTENTYGIWDKFEITGSNAGDVQLSWVLLMPNGKYRIVNNYHNGFPMSINGVLVPWVADLDPNLSGAAAVIPRPDLRPSLVGAIAGGVPKIHSVDVTSRGEIIHLGYFNQIGSNTVAQKGFIENNGVIYDLAIDNADAFFATQYAEIANVGYGGYTGTNPSTGVIRIDPISRTVIGGTGGGFGITPMDFLVVNGKLLAAGSLRTVVTPNGTIGEFNPVTNTWTSHSNGLFTSPGASSHVNTVTPIPAGVGCTNCFLFTGNFNNPGSGQLASSQNYMTKGCEIGGTLPVSTVISVQRLGRDAKITWSNGTIGSDLEWSIDGNQFQYLAKVMSETGYYVDVKGGGYYRITKGNESSKIVYLSPIDQVKILSYPGRAQIILAGTASYEIVSMTGQVVQRGTGRTIEFVAPSGVYVLRFAHHIEKFLIQ